MGLIKAATRATTSVLKDQWKEYFYCDAMPIDILCTRGKKKTNGKSSNDGNDNIISNGSAIAVADGQCMLIVEQGMVVEMGEEPGIYVYDNQIEPSIFTGRFNKQHVMDMFNNIGKRFTYGGGAGSDQRVYFINTKELFGNKYGTPSPIPFRVVDQRAGIDIDISVRCFGEYSYRIVNPLLFYTNVCGNITSDYMREDLESQMKSELLTALQPAFSKISEMGIRYSSLPGHTLEFAEALKEQLSSKWKEYRGIEIQQVGVSSINASKEDEDMLKELQKNVTFTNPNLATAHLVNAQATAMQQAASNQGTGAAMAFMGMNMAQAQGGVHIADLYTINQAQVKQNTDVWICSNCHSQNTGNFCIECGTKKDGSSNGWECPNCHTNNTGKFCSNCGQKRQSSQYKCNKCGYTPTNPSHPPKFCPECGDPFNNDDLI